MLVEGDINEPNILKKDMEGVSHVIHLAVIVSIIGSVEDPFTNHKINSTGTLSVLHQAARSGVQKVVFTSSCAVYGDTSSKNISEDSPLGGIQSKR